MATSARAITPVCLSFFLRKKNLITSIQSREFSESCTTTTISPRTGIWTNPRLFQAAPMHLPNPSPRVIRNPVYISGEDLWHGVYFKPFTRLHLSVCCAQMRSSRYVMTILSLWGKMTTFNIWFSLYLSGRLTRMAVSFFSPLLSFFWCW